VTVSLGSRRSVSARGRVAAVRLPLEIVVVWLLVAVVVAEIGVTYARLAADELYNVSGSGLAGGASRVLVFLNYPLALVAIGVLVLLVEQLGPRLRWLAVVGIALSAAVFWPKVVDPGDLDAKPVNAIAACGVAAGAAVTVLVWRAGGLERSLDRTAWRLRVVLAAVALVIAVPWVAAESGVSFSGTPVLGTLYQTDEPRAQPDDPALHPAVHAGHHHGMDGVLLTWSALLLLPLAGRIGARGLRLVATAYLTLMVCYGAALVANDAWLEQIVKRGWTDWEIPNPTEPSLSAIWGVIVVATAALTAAIVRRNGTAARER
jgi:hypothetical protein